MVVLLGLSVLPWDALTVCTKYNGCWRQAPTPDNLATIMAIDNGWIFSMRCICFLFYSLMTNDSDEEYFYFYQNITKVTCRLTLCALLALS